jgi:hypothetical protein
LLKNVLKTPIKVLKGDFVKRNLLLLTFVFLFSVSGHAIDCVGNNGRITFDNGVETLRSFDDFDERSYWESKLLLENSGKLLLREMKKIDDKIETGERMDLAHAGEDNSIKEWLGRMHERQEWIESFQAELAKKYPRKYRDCYVRDRVRWDIFYYNYLHIVHERTSKNIRKEIGEENHLRAVNKTNKNETIYEGIVELEGYGLMGDVKALYFAGTNFLGFPSATGAKIKKSQIDYNRGVRLLLKGAEKGNYNSIGTLARTEPFVNSKGLLNAKLAKELTSDKGLLYTVLAARKGDGTAKIVLEHIERVFKGRAKNYEAFKKEGFFQDDEFKE